MTTENTVENKDIILEMIEAGVVYGHKKSKTHPSMKPFVAVNRQEIEFLDPDAVLAYLGVTADFLAGLVKEKSTILFVGTTSGARKAVEEFAKELNSPYVTTRWIGGTITNFDVIKKRIDYYKDLQRRRDSGELNKYTKKERQDFDKKIEKMSWFFSGLTGLEKRPSALFVVDAEVHKTAVREAKRVGIPVIAIVDTDDDPSGVDYPIIANDHARSSVEWVIGKIREKITSN